VRVLLIGVPTQFYLPPSRRPIFEHGFRGVPPETTMNKKATAVGQ